MLEDFQGDSWGSIPPLHMSSLLPHDLCYRRSASRWPPTVKKNGWITFRTVLWTKCLFSPKFLCWITNLQYYVIWRQGNWEVMRWMRSRRWGPHDGIIAFIRRGTRELFLSLPCEIQQELTICKPRGGPSPGTDSVSTLILNKPHNCEKEMLCLIPFNGVLL